VRKQINDHLKSITELKAIVGTRIYRGRGPQNESKPYVTWSIIDDDPDSHPLDAARDHDRAILQVDFWSQSGPTVASMAEILSTQMDHDDLLIDDKQFTFLIEDPGTDADEQQVTGSEQQLFHIIQTWIVWHDPV